ncbi:hypothetical protein [Sphingomonas sp. 3-13AW]|jgi:hypothetical protein|uniref:hypothetical protein n=1 Tax=Sphingomonas sp. 3-13AW TaxID=3050450 RepID=UPI003BB72715
MTGLPAVLLVALAAQVAAAVSAPAEPDRRRTSPINWEALDALPYRVQPEVTPQMVEFVSGEMHEGRCTAPAPVAGKRRVHTDVAVLVGAGASVRATIPRAINCPTVEQYAAGLVLGFARGNLNPRFAVEGTWYRVSMTFDLPE